MTQTRKGDGIWENVKISFFKKGLKLPDGSVMDYTTDADGNKTRSHQKDVYATITLPKDRATLECMALNSAKLMIRDDVENAVKAGKDKINVDLSTWQPGRSSKNGSSGNKALVKALAAVGKTTTKDGRAITAERLDSEPDLAAALRKALSAVDI